ncbi:MAG: hypothetical protein QOJ31_1548, partial [Gaiellales bacterium]|nr:hypothetical protein [Gaiellales bacterium]
MRNRSFLSFTTLVAVVLLATSCGGGSGSSNSSGAGSSSGGGRGGTLTLLANSNWGPADPAKNYTLQEWQLLII